MPKREGGDDSLDNAIPLCFECHAKVEHYNALHPRGRRFRRKELKVRREQVYEEHTRHLVPGIRLLITQKTRDGGTRQLPDVGCTVVHKGNGPQVHLRVRLVASLGDLQRIAPQNHYGGTWKWNLNRDQEVWGHFGIPRRWKASRRRIKVVASVIVVDVYAYSGPS